MTLVEVSDGFADNIVGFSAEDMVANAVGAGFSYLRNTRPNLKKLVDYRIEYLPNYTKDGWTIDTFYADQKYLLAWKLSGIDAFKNKPLRFFELHTGYYARGYSSKELGDEKQRNGYIGVGMNLSEAFGLGKGILPREVASSLQDAFVWYDFFGVPQACDREVQDVVVHDAIPDTGEEQDGTCPKRSSSDHQLCHWMACWMRSLRCQATCIAALCLSSLCLRACTSTLRRTATSRLGSAAVGAT